MSMIISVILILILIMTSIQEQLKANGRKLTKRRIGTTTHHHHPVSRVSTRHCPQRRIRRSTSKRGIIIIRRRDCLHFHQQITCSDLSEKSKRNLYLSNMEGLSMAKQSLRISSNLKHTFEYSHFRCSFVVFKL